MLLRILGVAFVILLVLGFTVRDRNGQFNIEILFFGGCGAILLVIVIAIIRRCL